MHNPRTRKRPETAQVAETESFDAWFAREMKGLNLDLTRLEAAPEPATPQGQAKQAAAVASVATDGAAPAGQGLQASRGVTVAPPPADAWPTGTDLADPKNFGVRPPTEDLEQGSATGDEYRQRLARHIAFATTVLHTSRVPAVVWREWRTFEKAAQERLRELATVLP